MNSLRILAAAGCVALLGACGTSLTGPPMVTASQPGPTTSSATTPVDQAIVYAKSWDKDGVPTGSVEVKKPSDLKKLVGAPDDFVDFVGQELADAKRLDAQYPDCDPPGISVDGIDPGVGVAKGSEWGCGEGAETLWIRWKGQWVQTVGSQMGWNCWTLADFMVPTSFAGPTCTSFAGPEPRQIGYEGPVPRPESPGTRGEHVVYMSTLDPDSHGADGVRVHIEDDPTPLLKGAPTAFVDEVLSELGEGCDVMVDGIDPAVGIATGSTIACDRARAVIWIHWNDRWIEAASTSGRWSCDELKKFRVPADITGNVCSEWDYNGKESVIGYEPVA